MKIFPTQTVVVASSSGGESTDVHTVFLEKAGPSSYATGGFEIDLSAIFTAIGSANLQVVKGTRNNVPFGRFEYSIAGAVLTVKVMQERYDRITATGNVQNQPAGVTVRSAAGSTSSSESAHTHATDHNHGSFASAAATAAGASVALDVLGPSIATHTHTLDLNAITGTSGAGTAHNHTDNTLYEHDHAETHTTTNAGITELANATDLSATLFSLRVTGERA